MTTYSLQVWPSCSTSIGLQHAAETLERSTGQNGVVTNEYFASVIVRGCEVEVLRMAQRIFTEVNVTSSDGRALAYAYEDREISIRRRPLDGVMNLFVGGDSDEVIIKLLSEASPPKTLVAA